MISDDELVLPLLRNRRDYVWRAIELERRVETEQPGYPPWLNRTQLIEELMLEFALLNAAIARRIGDKA